jgi:hypothetical protein
MGFVHEKGSVGQQASPHRGSSSRMEAGVEGRKAGAGGERLRPCEGAGEGVAARARWDSYTSAVLEPEDVVGMFSS